MRIVFMGLLGPDAASVTYKAPNGSLKTEKTVGSNGAYLLVFPFNTNTCNLYTHSRFASYGPCGSTESVGGASPDDTGAVKAVTYRDGHVCHLTPNLALLNRYTASIKALAKKLRINLRDDHLSAKVRREVEAAIQKYRTNHHLTPKALDQARFPVCPASGYVAPREKRVTAAMVATPISVKIVPNTPDGTRVDISFIAHEPVTSSSSSWYEDSLTFPSGCKSGGEGGQIDLGNVHAGQRLRDKEWISSCRGVYRGVIGYMQNGGAINQAGSGGGTPSHDGSVVVGRFHFTIH